MRTVLMAGCAGLAGVLALAAIARAQQPAPASQWAGIYSEAQARRGQPLYADNCAACHGADLEGTISAPALQAPMMAARGGRSMAELFEYVQVFMPLTSPGGLSRAQNADILAYVFSKAGYPAGKTELPVAPDALGRIRIVAGAKP